MAAPSLLLLLLLAVAATQATQQAQAQCVPPSRPFNDTWPEAVLPAGSPLVGGSTSSRSASRAAALRAAVTAHFPYPAYAAAPGAGPFGLRASGDVVLESLSATAELGVLLAAREGTAALGVELAEVRRSAGAPGGFESVAAAATNTTSSGGSLFGGAATWDVFPNASLASGCGLAVGEWRRVGPVPAGTLLAFRGLSAITGGGQWSVRGMSSPTDEGAVPVTGWPRFVSSLLPRQANAAQAWLVGFEDAVTRDTLNDPSGPRGGFNDLIMIVFDTSLGPGQAADSGNWRNVAPQAATEPTLCVPPCLNGGRCVVETGTCDCSTARGVAGFHSGPRCDSCSCGNATTPGAAECMECPLFCQEAHWNSTRCQDISPCCDASGCPADVAEAALEDPIGPACVPDEPASSGPARPFLLPAAALAGIIAAGVLICIGAVVGVVYMRARRNQEQQRNSDFDNGGGASSGPFGGGGGAAGGGHGTVRRPDDLSDDMVADTPELQPPTLSGTPAPHEYGHLSLGPSLRGDMTPQQQHETQHEYGGVVPSGLNSVAEYGGITSGPGTPGYNAAASAVGGPGDEYDGLDGPGGEYDGLAVAPSSSSLTSPSMPAEYGDMPTPGGAATAATGGTTASTSPPPTEYGEMPTPPSAASVASPPAEYGEMPAPPTS